MLALFLACNGPDPLPTPTDDTSDDGVPNLLVEEARLDFGVLDDVGQSATLTITIQNAGTGNLEITGVAAEEPFSSLSQSAALAPQSIGQVTVQFAPTVYALEQASTLVIRSNDPDQPEIEVPLTGGVIVDADGDGYLRPEADGDDCDDSDAAINPGATEVYYDGVDQDCAEDDDYDQDLDGYQTDAFGGTDCNDVVAEIYPGAEDTWYDGVDTDCAGNNDFDMDQDGYGSKAHNKGKDCDDEDPDAYPSADERLNGKLDDCDGSRDWKVNPNTAPVILTGDGNNQQTGFGIALGDYDGDGSTDTVVGARYDNNGVGAVYLLDGASFPTEAEEDLPGLATEDFGGESNNAYMGSAMVTLNDGDLAVSAYGQNYNYGKVYLFEGSDLSNDFDTDSAHTTITGTSGAYYVGRGLGSSDLDGDGSDDTLMYYSSSTSSSSGQARIGLQYGGSDDGNISVNSVDAIFTTSSTNNATFESMSGGYDLDGDGYEDWVYCDPGDDSAASNAGAVWVIWGSDSRYSGSDSLNNDGQRVVVGEDSSDGTGSHCVLLPDMNGDGKAELAVWTDDTGDLSIFFGTAFGSDNVYTDADWMLDMTDTNSVSVIRPTGDINGNGTDDWVLGIDSTSASDGRLYIFDGDQSAGDYQVDDAIAFVRTSTDDENSYYGHAIPVYPGDADNDGALDLLVGDYGYSGEINGDGNTHSGTGALYVYFGL